jgi:hypothetical protein
MLFQKRVVCTKLDICVFILLLKEHEYVKPNVIYLLNGRDWVKIDSPNTHNHDP